MLTKKIIFLFFSFFLFSIICNSQEEKTPVNIKADYISSSKGVKVASGNVKIEYENVIIFADFLGMDEEDVVYAYGTVTLIINFEKEKKTEKITGETLRYSLKKKEGVFCNVSGFSDPVYFSGEKIQEYPKGANFTKGTFTTCDKEKPHYRLKAKEVFIYKEDKLVAKKVSSWVGQEHIATLPIYVVSLKEKKRQPFAPQAGYNEQDGFYLKTMYNYYFRPIQYGAIFFDYLEKKGIGKGFEHKVGLVRQGEASLYLYHKEEKDSKMTNLTTRVNYKQPFPRNIDVSANVDFYNQVYTYPIESKVLNSTLKITKREKDGQINTRQSFGYLGGLANQKDFRTVFQYTKNLKQNINYTINLDYANTQRGKLYPNEELNSRIEAKYTLPNLELNLLTNKRYDLDGAKNQEDNYSVLEKIPELTLKFPSLIHKNKSYPLSTQFLFGKYYYSEGRKEINQYKGELQLQFNKLFKITRNSAFNLTNNFKQAFYEDNSAIYTVGTATNINTTHHKYIKSNVSFNYENSWGYTPYCLERRFPSNNIGGGLNIGNNKIMLSLSTGYNFIVYRYQNLLSRLTINPNESLKISLSGEYDLNRNEPLDLYSNLQIKSKKTYQFTNSMIYDMLNKKLRRIDNELQANVGKFWKVHYVSSCDVQNNRFIYNDFLISRDMHCWEARFAYKELRRAYLFELNLKAFPAEAVKVGVDEQGIQTQTLSASL